MSDLFTMPAQPSYFMYGGLPVYFRQARHYGNNPSGWLPQFFILHDTDGRDSRQELYDSPRLVSVHYLVGAYSGYSGPIVVKYLSEVSNYANGAGYATLGGSHDNLNLHAIQFELEYLTMSAATLQAYATVIASSLKYWLGKGADPRFLRHADIDSRKFDPRFHYNDMLRRVYDTLPLVP
jgi:N-acetyl-anhydromuramyl-L-alanine amidase AmpD